jgi:hypothetical protein
VTAIRPASFSMSTSRDSCEPSSTRLTSHPESPPANQSTQYPRPPSPQVPTLIGCSLC